MLFTVGPAVWLATLAGAGLAVHASRAVLDWGGGTADRAVEDWLYCGVFAVVAVCLLLRARRDRPSRVAWYLGAVAMAVWCAAEISFRLIEPADATSYPDATRALLFLAFLLAATTLVLLARRRVRHLDRGLLLDGVIGGLAVAAVAAAFLFAGDGGDGGQPGPPAVFLLADLGILAFVVATLALTGWRPAPAGG